MDGRADCFYSRGVYFAHRSRYSHRYAFRSSDLEGAVPSADGPKQPAPWRKEERLRSGAGRIALGDAFDSVEGGPHRPSRAGAGEDDSLVCVVYKSSQAMAEFVVTYKVACALFSVLIMSLS